MNIFLDSDGVMADFEGHYLKLFNHECHTVPDKDMWKNIERYPSFFYDLPLFDGALDFYKTLKDYCFHYDHSLFILTACPREHYALHATHKKNFYKDKVDPTVFVLPMISGKNKFLFMQNKEDILIDDFYKNIEGWSTAGGNAILFKNYDQVLKEILK